MEIPPTIINSVLQKMLSNSKCECSAVDEFSGEDLDSGGESEKHLVPVAKICATLIRKVL